MSSIQLKDFFGLEPIFLDSWDSLDYILFSQSILIYSYDVYTSYRHTTWLIVIPCFTF